MVLDNKNKPSVNKLIAKAKKPGKISPILHKFYEGKVQVMPKCSISSTDDFTIWYTPGVAAASKEIITNPNKSFELTNRWNYVAVVTDGSRVLGLGDIGPEGATQLCKEKLFSSNIWEGGCFSNMSSN